MPWLLTRGPLVRARPAAGQPGEVGGQPVPQPGPGVVVERAAAVEQPHRVEEVVEVLELDDAGADPLVAVPAHAHLGVAQVRGHPRRRVGEPGADVAGGVRGELGAPGDLPGQRQRGGVVEQPLQPGAVVAVAAGLVEPRARHPPAVAPEVGPAAGQDRVRPPVGGRVPVVVRVAARRQAGLVHHAERPAPQRLARRRRGSPRPAPAPRRRAAPPAPRCGSRRARPGPGRAAAAPRRAGRASRGSPSRRAWPRSRKPARSSRSRSSRPDSSRATQPAAPTRPASAARGRRGGSHGSSRQRSHSPGMPSRQNSSTFGRRP